MNRVFFSICAIIRNEAPYVAEWIEFHRLVGVERFYLYDDASTDRTVEIIRRHDRGDIVLESWRYNPEAVCRAQVPFRATHQVVAYNDFLLRRRAESQLVAFIDVDEFLYHATDDDLREPLYEDLTNTDASALFVNWLIFGDSGHKTKPDGLTIAAYTHRAEDGQPMPYGCHGKLIAKPERLDQFGPMGSHNATFRSGGAVNEKGYPVIHATNPQPSADRWRLNHYYHRSAAEAAARVAAVDNNAVAGFHKTAERMRKHNRNEVEDRGILRFVDHVRYRLEEV